MRSSSPQRPAQLLNQEQPPTATESKAGRANLQRSDSPLLTDAKEAVRGARARSVQGRDVAGLRGLHRRPGPDASISDDGVRTAASCLLVRTSVTLFLDSVYGTFPTESLMYAPRNLGLIEKVSPCSDPTTNPREFCPDQKPCAHTATNLPLFRPPTSDNPNGQPPVTSRVAFFAPGVRTAEPHVARARHRTLTSTSPVFPAVLPVRSNQPVTSAAIRSCRIVNAATSAWWTFAVIRGSATQP
eukprot:SAG31_NODE_3985_length_3685_cov_2.692694_2_plen_243_part_00